MCECRSGQFTRTVIIPFWLLPITLILVPVPATGTLPIGFAGS